MFTCSRVLVLFFIAVAVNGDDKKYCEPETCPPGLQLHAACNVEFTWDDELAEIAKYNLLKCKMKHDTGQNLRYMSDTDNEFIVKRRPEAWFKEYENTDMNDIRSHKIGGHAKSIGHFTQVVRDLVTKVGCAISKFWNSDGYMALIACDYAVANIQDWPVYDDGPTASECTSGTKPKYPGLCSVDEVYEGMFFKN